jgi:hypothetical protein
MKPTLAGLVRSLDDAQTNTHPYPILVHPLWFRTLCVSCGAVAVGPERSTIALAVTDRMVHARTAHA